MKTIFIDCTDTALTQLNTGIQRVVRRVAQQALEQPASDCRFLPVAYIGGRADDAYFMRLKHSEIRSKHLHSAYRRLQKYLLKQDKYRSRTGLQARCKRFFYGLTVEAFKLFHSGRILKARSADALVLLDSVWATDGKWPLRMPLKMKLVTVVYDLIPLSHPQHCHVANVESFIRSYLPVLRCSDHLVSISRFTRSQLLEAHFAQAQTYFHLGADVGATADESTFVDRECLFPFKGVGQVYLSVGTLEPRKSYEMTLQVFEQLWAAGSDCKWVIVGKYGWNCGDLVDRIVHSPYYSERLFWLEHADDAALDYAYRHANALVFASDIEGFGLPLVEALHHGLQVIASDIPVFREIGGDSVHYFNRTPEDLARIIRKAEDGALPKLPTGAMPTWKQSAATLFHIVKQLLDENADSSRVLDVPPRAKLLDDRP